MAALLKFNKGLYANLPAVRKEGNVYITTDEHAMYVDIGNGDNDRIRIGQIISLTSAQWEAKKPPYADDVFYYLTDVNALLRYVKNAEGNYEWKQINGTADIKADVADLKTRMGQAETNISTNTTAIEAHTTAIQNLQNAGYQANVVEGAKIGTTDVEIDGNKKLILGKFAAAAKTTIEKEDLADGLKSEITEATNNINDLTTAVETLNGEEGAAGSVKTIAKGYADSKNNAITAAQNAADAAQGTANEAVAAAAEADRKAVAAQGTANTNAKNIGDLDTRLTALDAANTGKIAVVEGRVSTLEGQVTGLQTTTGTNTQDISKINTKIGTTEFAGDSLTGAIKSLQTKTSENGTNISGLDGRLTTAEGKITALEKDMTQAKTDIITAQNAADAAQTYAETTVKPIADTAKETAEQNKKDIATVSGNLGTLTTEVNTIKDTYQTKAKAAEQHKEITDDIAELQAALGTGGTGADSITSRLTAVEGVAANAAADLLVEVNARKQTDANLAKLEADIGNLSNVMNFLGVSTTDPALNEGTGAVTIGDKVITPEVGDVVIYGAKEFVYANGKWNEYGDASGNANAIEVLNGKVSTIESDLNTEKTGLKARMTAVETKASTNDTNITNLTTKVDGMYTNAQIDALLTWGEF